MNADGIDAGKLGREVRGKDRDVGLWSEHRCFQYHLSGRLAILMENREFIAGPGDAHHSAERPRCLGRRRGARDQLSATAVALPTAASALQTHQQEGSLRRWPQ